MIYLYYCQNCGLEFDIIKPAADYKRPEPCPSCRCEMDRIFTPPLFHGSKNEWPEYNPAFGKVIRGKSHRKEEARKLGVEEVGTESLNTIHKTFDNMREDNRNERYRKIESDLGLTTD